MLVLPPEKRMGKAPPDDLDPNWFDVVIAKETHEYQARALPPEIIPSKLEVAPNALKMWDWTGVDGWMDGYSLDCLI